MGLMLDLTVNKLYKNLNFITHLETKLELWLFPLMSSKLNIYFKMQLYTDLDIENDSFVTKGDKLMLPVPGSSLQCHVNHMATFHSLQKS